LTGLERLEHIDPVVALQDLAFVDHEVQRALTQGTSEHLDRINLDTDAHGWMLGQEEQQNGEWTSIRRLAALGPRPRLHLVRFHGMAAPSARNAISNNRC
jgi:hypothetical protein